jgi:HK97 family phage portal protein
MSIWSGRSRPPAAKRSTAAPGPWQPTFPFTYGQIGRGYQDIDPTLGETALQSVAFRSGVDLIASIVSELPLEVYSGEGSSRKKRPTPGYLEDPAGDGYGREDWFYQWIVSWMLRGNSFAGIVDKGPTGMIRQADIFHPDTISVSQIDGGTEWRVSGQPIADGRMYHKRVNPVPGTLMGLSAVQAHADSIGLSLATTRFGRTWFQDGGHPGGILTNDQADLSDDKLVTKAKDRFMAALFGTREPIVLGKGWKYEQIQVAPEESQFLQTVGWSEAQCARILGPGVAEVLGYPTDNSMTYSTVVDRDISLLKYSVGKWVKRIERMISGTSATPGWLPRPQYACLDKDAFLETSAMQRWALNAQKLGTGAYTINEVRETENDPPVDWGNKPFILKAVEPANNTPQNVPADPTTGAPGT